MNTRGNAQAVAHHGGDGLEGEQVSRSTPQGLLSYPPGGRGQVLEGEAHPRERERIQGTQMRCRKEQV